MQSLFVAFLRFFNRTAPLVLLMLVLVREAPPADDLLWQVSGRVGAMQFDFIGWMLQAVGAKAAQSVSAEQSYLPPDRRKQLVLDYFEQMDRALTIERDIDRLYADPDQPSPGSASAPLKAELDDLRREMRELQPIAEAVLQEQIAAVLAEQGFAVGGQILPPVAFRITALPGFLVVSPRDQIKMEAYANIIPGVTADGEAALEDRIERDLDVSALVVPLGGLGTYPTMIYETPNLNYIAEVGAHEWVHNYLSLRPLGALYIEAPELRTMNETAATIAGREIGQAVIARYYPERAPPAPQPTSAASPAPTPTPDPKAFNFNAEMHETRVRVDELLAAGRIEEAEAYMEARRRVFIEHGYQLRKLNQAYFAFYGAYNIGTGAAGEDPVGPAVRLLRQQSPTLKAFLDDISWMTSFEELQRAIEDQHR